MKDEGIVYEGARESIPPFPDCASETLAMVSETLAPGQSARFEKASETGVIPEGCKWEVSGEIGTLTKIAT